jgi:hypothetical protein
VALVGIGVGDGERGRPGGQPDRHTGPGLDAGDVGHLAHRVGGGLLLGRLGEFDLDVPVALCLALLVLGQRAGAQRHAGDEHGAGGGEQPDRQPEPSGPADSVAHRHEQSSVEAGKAAEPGQHRGGSAGCVGAAVVVDRVADGRAAGLEQCRQCQQDGQAEADGHDDEVGPAGRGEAGGGDAEHPGEAFDPVAADQDGGVEREQGGRRGDQYDHRQVQPSDVD